MTQKMQDRMAAELAARGVTVKATEASDAEHAIWCCMRWETYQHNHGVTTVPDRGDLAPCSVCGAIVLYNLNAPEFIRKVCQECAVLWQSKMVAEGTPAGIVMTPESVRDVCDQRERVERAHERLSQEDSE